MTTSDTSKSELAKVIMRFIKSHNFTKSKEQVISGLPEFKREKVASAISDLMERKFIEEDINGALTVTNYGFRAMQWISDDVVEAHEKVLASAEMDLRNVLNRLRELGDVRFLNSEDGISYEFDDIEESYADGTIYIKLY